MRSFKSVFVRCGARVLVLVLGLGAAPLACLAATINVTTTGDAGGAGGCTVRQAIATINNGAGPDSNIGNCSIASGTLGTNDQILFDLVTFPNGGVNTITLADASTSTLSIYAANLTIDATANGQVAIQRPSGAANKFGIMGDSTAGSLTLNHLTLSNGAGGVCAGAYGGGGGIGICASAVNLTLNNCTLDSNSSDNRGGGIWSENGSVTLNNSTLSGNSASSKDGGGISSAFGAVSLTNSTLSGNSALNGEGGGVEVLTGSLTLTNSTLSSNQAQYGGGISSNNGAVTLSNSTVSGNSSSSIISGAGGIEQTSAGSVTATNSTISANTGGYYGGIFGNPGSISVTNTIVAGNSGSYYPLQIPPGFNSSGSITDGDPQLGALANNGGPTQTMLPLPSSPAVDAIACTNAPATDQRGVARPQGGQCDIGAVETANPFTMTVDTTQDSVAVDGKCSLRQALAIFTLGRSSLDSDCPPSGSADNQILFAPTLAGSSIALTSQLNLDHNLAVTIDGSGAPGVSLDGSNTTLIVNVASGSSVTIQHLQMVNGNSVGSDGGAITNAGTLTLTDTVLSNNVSNIGGGAIRNSGTLNINHGTLSDNIATGSGGAIDVEGGVLTMADSTVTANQAGAGGGVFVASTGTLNLARSNVSTNHALSASGGGVASDGHFVIGNSTFFGNTAAGDGGAIYSNKAANTSTLVNTTLSGNSAAHGGNAANAAGTLLLRNSIVANASAGNNCFGTITIATGVLSWPASDATCGALDVANPMLGTLQDNGGPSFTMLPGTGSAAIDMGNTAICASTPINNLDQRGVWRPQGAACDIGAVEVVTSRIFADNFDGTLTP